MLEFNQFVDPLTEPCLCLPRLLLQLFLREQFDDDRARDGEPGTSHIVLVLRDDAERRALLVRGQELPERDLCFGKEGLFPCGVLPFVDKLRVGFVVRAFVKRDGPERKIIGGRALEWKRRIPCCLDFAAFGRRGDADDRGRVGLDRHLQAVAVLNPVCVRVVEFDRLGSGNLSLELPVAVIEAGHGESRRVFSRDTEVPNRVVELEADGDARAGNEVLQR